VLFFVVKKRINCFDFLKYIIPFFIISIIQLAVIVGATQSSSIFMMLKMFVGFGIISLVNDKFPKVYVEVMSVIAAVSLILFFYNNYFGVIPGIRYSSNCVSIFIYNQLYSDAVGVGFTSRNCGMFWEPGAFQGYLNIALFFLLYVPQYKFKKLECFVIVVALLTTKSTTGFLCMALIALYFLLTKYKTSLFSRIISTMVVLGVFSYAYINLDFMHDKIEHHQNLETYEEGRLNDYIRFAKLIENNMFTGISSEANDKAATGNGFLAFWVYYGIVGIVTYFGFLWYNIKKQAGYSFALLMLLLIFLTLQGEGFLQYPCYLAWPFLRVTMDRNKYFVDEG
jgi:hypothetical protein